MTTTELFTSGDAVADANGRAEVRMQPLTAFERWRVARMTIHSDSSTLVPTLRVYRGGVSNSAMVDNSQTGTLDHSDTNLLLRNGEPLIFEWTGADVGATCTAIIEGDVIK